MKGRIEGRAASAVVTTECAHCGDPIRIETDGRARAVAAGSTTLVFAPLVDFRSWKEPSIIDGF